MVAGERVPLMGGVYALRPVGLGVVKVGRTGDSSPEARRRSNQTGCPSPLVVAFWWPHPDPVSAERAMHGLLAHRHSHLEWFTASDEELVRAWGRVVGAGPLWLWWAVTVARARGMLAAVVPWLVVVGWLVVGGLLGAALT